MCCNAVRYLGGYNDSYIGSIGVTIALGLILVTVAVHFPHFLCVFCSNSDTPGRR